MTKRIVNGRMYDTDKAEQLHRWDNGLPRRDFNSCSESLYRTPSGRFFLLGGGGPMSKYSRAVGDNTWTGNDDVITPLTDDEAMAWLETHGADAEIICKYFDVEDA